MLLPLDRERLKAQFNAAQPFRWIEIYPFMEPEFAQALAASYPDFESSRKQGLEFAAVNEQRKVQIVDSKKFPAPVKKLNDLLASPAFLADVEYITGIPRLLADPELEGGGMHVTGARGRLDVHVDFNVTDKGLHRRLNILVYLNPVWEKAWGGNIELWDKDVKSLHHSFEPIINRCVLFETNEISFHGVSPVKCPDSQVRKSFAAYYYTEEAPAHWDGSKHTTVFRARPDEVVRANLLMPLENAQRRAREEVRKAKQIVKKLIGRD